MVNKELKGGNDWVLPRIFLEKFSSVYTERRNGVDTESSYPPTVGSHYHLELPRRTGYVIPFCVWIL